MNRFVDSVQTFSPWADASCPLDAFRGERAHSAKTVWAMDVETAHPSVSLSPCLPASARRASTSVKPWFPSSSKSTSELQVELLPSPLPSEPVATLPSHCVCNKAALRSYMAIWMKLTEPTRHTISGSWSPNSPSKAAARSSSKHPPGHSVFDIFHKVCKHVEKEGS